MTGSATAMVDGPRSETPPARFAVQLPRPGDPRLHVAAVLVTVQVLGQVSIGFDLSIAQILVAVGTAGAIEVLLTARRSRVIAWPASALLTGNGIALLLRVPGTEHGDWFSMRGWYVFAATAALAVLSKYVIRVGDRPLFNPSNLGLVATFFILGARFADPQDLWWGPMSPGLALTYVVIIVGGVLITRRLHLLAVSASFMGVFAVLMAALAWAGHEILARWSLEPVGGVRFWTTVVLSPEILIFVFFMITDPRTAARGRTASVLYAAMVAATSAVLISFQSTEYATKVALLTGLVLVCAARPLIERIAPAADDESPGHWMTTGSRRGVTTALAGSAVLALVFVGSATAATGPVSPVAGGARPPVELRDDQRPEVELGAGAKALGGSFDRSVAQSVVTDVVSDVVLADRAVASSDRDLAAQIATGPFLEQTVGRSPEPAPDRTVRTAVVDVVRDPENFQAVPRLSVTLVGTSDGAPWSATFHTVPRPGGSLIERQVPAP